MNEDKSSMKWNTEQVNFVRGLLEKGCAANLRTAEYSNFVSYPKSFDFTSYAKVDDLALLSVCQVLLPNIWNYLLNVLPQLVYPYVVAYLQDLSNMSEDDAFFTVNDLFDLVKELLPLVNRED